MPDAHARRGRDDHVPLAVLLAGLTGSGKTTVAQALASHGFTRLSVDEEVHRLHGRYGVDYPEHTYFERERPVVAAIRQRFIKEIEAGNGVVLDHGLWRRSERDAWRPPPSRLPPRQPSRTAAAPCRAQPARGRQRADRHPPKPSTTSPPVSMSRPRTRK